MLPNILRPRNELLFVVNDGLLADADAVGPVVGLYEEWELPHLSPLLKVFVGRGKQEGWRAEIVLQALLLQSFPVNDTELLP